MEMHHKLKQQIQNDNGHDGLLEQETTAESSELEALRHEVEELKEHINTNFQIYLKRLERRKAKIRCLEEQLSDSTVLMQNLEDRLKEAESYKVYYEEAKGSLEQLENHQNQELCTVKHMLLAAQTALDQEQQQRQHLQHLLDQSSPKAEQLVVPVKDQEDEEHRLEAVTGRAGSGEDVAQLLAHVTTLKADNERLSSEVKRLEHQVQEGDSRMSSLLGEHDNVKTSLLEYEIAKHERDQQEDEQVERLKVQLVQLSTEKETLQMTLTLRENEAKGRKEEWRKQQEAAHTHLSELQEQLQCREQRIVSLEAELEATKCSLSDRLMRMRLLQKDQDRVCQELDSAKAQTDQWQRQCGDLSHSQQDLLLQLQEERRRARDTQHQLDDSSRICLQLQNTITQLSSDLEAATARMAQLAEQLVQVQQQRDQLQQQVDQVERTFPERVEQSERVQSLRHDLAQLNSQMDDKKKTIKLLQQRLADMKKTLQKELKSGIGCADAKTASCGGGMMMMSEVSLAAEATIGGQSEGSDSDATVATDRQSEINLKYLKHVLFKFLTSREYEAKKLTRAIATLLHFSAEEEQFVQDHLDWKMSWFGSRPRYGSGQFSLSIDAS